MHKKLLPDPDHTYFLKLSLANQDSELKVYHTDDPELWDNGTWVSPPRLYCLHIERHPGLPDEFNLDRLWGWDKGRAYDYQIGGREGLAWSLISST